MSTSPANRGTAAERRAERCAVLMASLGIARLHRQHTPRVLRRNAGRIVGAVNAGKAPIDFVGTLRDGTAVVVEVKEASGASLPLSGSRMPLHQRAALDESLRWTPHVYLLVAFLARAPGVRRPGRGWSWHLVPWREARTWDRIRPGDWPEAPDLFLEGVVG